MIWNFLKKNHKDAHVTRKEFNEKNRSDIKNVIRKHFEIFNQSKEYLKDNNFLEFKNKNYSLKILEIQMELRECILINKMENEK